ncbi:hypothetical protein K439DRAFT_1610259 [Ramaria rubella]|nr:hypothetical protein K439DRAFT_1610259 [Ramaria rubella]
MKSPTIEQALSTCHRINTLEEQNSDEDEGMEDIEANIPPPPVSLVSPVKTSDNHAQKDDVNINSDVELPVRKQVYHYIEMEKALKKWHEDEPKECAVLTAQTKTPGTGSLYKNAPKFHCAVRAELKRALKLFTWPDLQDMNYKIKYEARLKPVYVISVANF